MQPSDVKFFSTDDWYNQWDKRYNDYLNADGMSNGVILMTNPAATNPKNPVYFISVPPPEPQPEQQLVSPIQTNNMRQVNTIATSGSSITNTLLIFAGGIVLGYLIAK